MGRYDHILDTARRNGTLPAPRPTPAAEPPAQHRPALWTPDGDESERPRLPLATPQYRFARSLLADHQRLREFVIEGVLREGETMNLIAPPKSHKSWMVLGLALDIATGSPWLGRFRTARRRVLLLDNELHPEVLASRIRTVADAKGLRLDDYADWLAVDSLRGRLVDIHAMSDYVDQVESGLFGFAVLDALYRFMPTTRSENDNASMAGVYNALDRYAGSMQCAIAAVHHASKGSQADKSVTDVGAGAGSQSRAADSHLILREHEAEGCYVLDAAVRSWAPLDPVVLRWTFPIWTVADDLDPTALRKVATPNEERQAAKDKEGIDRIVSSLTRSPGLSRTKLAAAAGMDPRRLDRLLCRMDDVIRRETSVIGGNPAEIITLIE